MRNVWTDKQLSRARARSTTPAQLPKELDRFGLRFYKLPPCSPQARLISGQITVGVSSFREIRVMGERIHTATGRSKTGTKKTWTLVITGTAVLVLAAGVMLQVTRPTSAFPEDGSAAAARSGKAVAGDQAPKKDKKVAKVGKEYISYEELAAECIRRCGKEVLDNLINRKIIQQACDDQGIEVSEAEVTKAIEKQAKDLGMTGDQLLQLSEAERNITPTQYRRDIVWPMQALRKLAGEDVKVTEEDIKKAYIKNYEIGRASCREKVSIR